MNYTPLEKYKRVSQLLPAIKGIAILMIVIYHLWRYSKGWTSSFSEIFILAKSKGLKTLLESILYIFCLMGEQGVHFFLIASGFGLSTSWWHKNQSSENRNYSFAVIPFWRRRLVRLLPLYWIANILILLLVLFQPNSVPYGQEIIKQGGMEILTAIFASLTTIRNFIIKYYFFLNGAWWYIGITIQLYLIFPLLIWCAKRWGWSKLLISSLTISLGYRFLIIALPFNKLVTDVLIRGAFFPSRLFEFVFGMTLAIALLNSHQYTKSKKIYKFYLLLEKLLFEYRWLPITILLWILGLACHWAFDDGWEFCRIPADALIGVGEFCAIFQIMNAVTITNIKKYLTIVGKYSYGIFLTHMNVMIMFWLLLNNFISFYWLRLLLVTIMTCIVGGYFEFIYNRIAEKFFLRESK